MDTPDSGPRGQAITERVLGYLNFSSGTFDPKFPAAVNQLFVRIESLGRGRDDSVPANTADSGADEDLRVHQHRDIDLGVSVLARVEIQHELVRVLDALVVGHLIDLHLASVGRLRRQIRPRLQVVPGLQQARRDLLVEDLALAVDVGV